MDIVGLPTERARGWEGNVLNICVCVCVNERERERGVICECVRVFPSLECMLCARERDV